MKFLKLVALLEKSAQRCGLLDLFLIFYKKVNREFGLELFKNLLQKKWSMRNWQNVWRIEINYYFFIYWAVKKNVQKEKWGRETCVIRENCSANATS